MDNLFKANKTIKIEKGEILQVKDNVLYSLQEVECFLRQGQNALKGAKLYNIIKKKNLS